MSYRVKRAWALHKKHLPQMAVVFLISALSMALGYGIRSIVTPLCGDVVAYIVSFVISVLVYPFASIAAAQFYLKLFSDDEADLKVFAHYFDAKAYKNALGYSVAVNIVDLIAWIIIHSLNSGMEMLISNKVSGIISQTADNTSAGFIFAPATILLVVIIKVVAFIVVSVLEIKLKFFVPYLYAKELAEKPYDTLMLSRRVSIGNMGKLIGYGLVYTVLIGGILTSFSSTLIQDYQQNGVLNLLPVLLYSSPLLIPITSMFNCVMAQLAFDCIEDHYE